MKYSDWFIPTLKESPADAEIMSHQLMLRAGMIRKLGSGLYTWLPLGLKVLRKVEAIIRREMNKAGAVELLMPAIQPAELWQETKRWEAYGDQLLRMQDSNQREYCFGPTHEEVITDLMRNELQSYKQLPCNFYQIQTKFRDEIRPRFGVMRAREFLMKDAYSFHIDSDSLQETYDKMYTAYCQVFDSIGVEYRVVDADSGEIGGAKSNEFQLLAASGEDVIFYSDKGNYAANIEKACSLLPEISPTPENLLAMQKRATPGVKSIQDLVANCDVAIENTIKTLIVHGTEQPLIALILRGDDELNATKAEKHPSIAAPLQLADEDTVLKHLGVNFGSLGPVDINIPTIIDFNARAVPYFSCGANENNYHYFNVTWERDVAAQDVFDLRNVKVGDPSPDGVGTLQQCRGIEVGHIFQLGTKYSESMGAKVLDANGKQAALQMGCYGLGVSRIVAAVIEQKHDERGIMWPSAIAPFTLSIIPINYHKSAAVKELADKIYQQCTDLGIDVLIDDRKERPGVMFADHDLIGIPQRIVIGDKLIDKQQIEYKKRSDADSSTIELAKLSILLKDIMLNVS